MKDEQVADCFAAADVVLLPRIDDINSGNLPMGFLFGNTVVGPDVGNMGAWLRETDNPVFTPGDQDSLRHAMEKALAASRSGRGNRNREFALSKWSTATIGRLHADLYRTLTSTP